MLNIPITPFPSIPASAIQRHARAASRRRELIRALRRGAALATEEAAGTPAFSDRVRLAQITFRVDEELRRLLNPGRAA